MTREESKKFVKDFIDKGKSTWESALKECFDKQKDTFYKNSKRNTPIEEYIEICKKNVKKFTDMEERYYLEYPEECNI
jgi:hypothetical protein